MAERDGDKIENDGIKHAALAALPAVESPPLSPAGASSDEPVAADAAAEAEVSVEASDKTEAAGAESSGTTEPVKEEDATVSALTASRRWLRLSRRQKHRLTLAAWVMLVAGMGALFGGAVSNGLAVRDSTDVASLAQRQAVEQSIDRLAKQVGELKTKLAAATAHSQVASNSIKNAAPAVGGSNADITGSIPAARTSAVPLPRPAPPRVAAAVSRAVVVHDWRILRARHGMIDVVGREGIYEVVPGAVLPGLGLVQSIERRGGRWMVVTPKGIIVSARDRGNFEDF